MKARLVLLKEDGTRKDIPLPNSVTVVGRRPDCDLCIPLVSVSRKHCQFNEDGGRLRVRDLGSKNGTIVNGEKISEVVLNPGDRLQIGPVKFTVQIDGKPERIDMSESAVQPFLDTNIFGSSGDDATMMGESDF